jgi:hypothetical protein
MGLLSKQNNVCLLPHIYLGTIIAVHKLPQLLCMLYVSGLDLGSEICYPS